MSKRKPVLPTVRYETRGKTKQDQISILQGRTFELEAKIEGEFEQHQAQVLSQELQKTNKEIEDLITSLGVDDITQQGEKADDDEIITEQPLPQRDRKILSTEIQSEGSPDYDPSRSYGERKKVSLIDGSKIRLPINKGTNNFISERRSYIPQSRPYVHIYDTCNVCKDIITAAILKSLDEDADVQYRTETQLFRPTFSVKDDMGNDGLFIGAQVYTHQIPTALEESDFKRLSSCSCVSRRSTLFPRFDLIQGLSNLNSISFFSKPCGVAYDQDIRPERIFEAIKEQNFSDLDENELRFLPMKDFLLQLMPEEVKAFLADCMGKAPVVEEIPDSIKEIFIKHSKDLADLKFALIDFAQNRAEGLSTETLIKLIRAYNITGMSLPGWMNDFMTQFPSQEVGAKILLTTNITSDSYSQFLPSNKDIWQEALRVSDFAKYSTIESTWSIFKLGVDIPTSFRHLWDSDKVQLVGLIRKKVINRQNVLQWNDFSSEITKIKEINNLKGPLKVNLKGFPHLFCNGYKMHLDYLELLKTDELFAENAEAIQKGAKLENGKLVFSKAVRSNNAISPKDDQKSQGENRPRVNRNRKSRRDNNVSNQSNSANQTVGRRSTSRGRPRANSTDPLIEASEKKSSRKKIPQESSVEKKDSRSNPRRKKLLAELRDRTVTFERKTKVREMLNREFPMEQTRGPRSRDTRSNSISAKTRVDRSS